MNSSSPTTNASTSGLKLNDPSLFDSSDDLDDCVSFGSSSNRSSISSSSSSVTIKNNDHAAISNRAIVGGGAPLGGDNAGAETDADHRHATTVMPAGAGKENRQPRRLDLNSIATRREELSPSKDQSGMRTNKGLVRNGNSAAEAVMENAMDCGVRLCYFDENNVMDGAVDDNGTSGNSHRNKDDDTGNNTSWSEDDCDEDDFLPNHHQPSPNQHVGDNDDANDDASNNGNDIRDNSYEEDDVDDCSEASGDTVVHNDCPAPPANATQEELNRHYWQFCYGEFEEEGVVGMGAVNKMGGSVLRSAPAKSCLSTNKKQNNGVSSNTSMTPRRILHSPENVNNNILKNIMEDPHQHLSTPTDDNMDDSTPKNNVTRLNAVVAKTSQSAVKFGNNCAAEFDFLKPITEMTPIPSSVVQKIFPSEVKETEKEIEEQGVSRETAKNVATLAAWDDDFDCIIDEDFDENVDGDDDDVNSHRPHRKRGRKHTPYKKAASGRRSSSRSMGLSRPRKSRRDSSIFSRERKSLIDDDDDLDNSMEMGDGDDEGSNRRGNLLPFSVTIDPEEYTSPSSSSMSVSTLGTPAGLANNSMVNTNDRSNMRDSLDSITSSCISPSSNITGMDTGLERSQRDGSASRYGGRESSGSSITTSTTATGKETPNSARTSSSTILRAVHSSGASLLPSNSPPQCGGVEPSSGNDAGGNAGGGLMPNQLKYSPSSNSGSSSADTLKMDSSPSSSESLGSEIMSLFTHQSLDDSAEDSNNSFYKLLSLFSTHPTQPFHTTMRDMVLWMLSSQKKGDPVAFMHDHLLKGLSASTSLSLVADEVHGVENIESMFCGTSAWLQSALFGCDGKDGLKCPSSFVQKNFEAMLLGEIKEMSSSPSSMHSSRSTQDRLAMTADDGEEQTISSCIQQLHRTSSLEWSSMEIDAAIRSLSRLQEFTETIENQTEECNKYVTSCCKKLLETLSMTMQALAKSNDTTTSLSKKKLQMRKRKVRSRKEEEQSTLKSLDDELSMEVIRLNRAKRVKQFLDTELETERSKPVSGLLEEIRTFISPLAIIHSDQASCKCVFEMLDGSAEIAIKICLEDDEDDDDDEEVSTDSNNDKMELVCFIRDGGQATKLLQGILLGNIDGKLDHTFVPFPLRESLSRAIIQDGTHLFSRIDNLVRSVRQLETNGVCTVNASADGDVTLSISMHHEGMVVQIGFKFAKLLGEDWQFTTAPDDVSVSIISTERDLTLLGSQLQQLAQSVLAAGSSSSDPILLRRLCSTVMESFSQAAFS